MVLHIENKHRHNQNKVVKKVTRVTLTLSRFILLDSLKLSTNMCHTLVRIWYVSTLLKMSVSVCTCWARVMHCLWIKQHQDLHYVSPKLLNFVNCRLIIISICETWLFGTDILPAILFGWTYQLHCINLTMNTCSLCL